MINNVTIYAGIAFSISSITITVEVKLDTTGVQGAPVCFAFQAFCGISPGVLFASRIKISKLDTNSSG